MHCRGRCERPALSGTCPGIHLQPEICAPLGFIGHKPVGTSSHHRQFYIAATLCIMAAVFRMATVAPMSPSSPKRGSAAIDRLVELLHSQGWEVERESGGAQPDLIARNGQRQYVVELKSASEGRPDRVLALLSQAILQATRYAEKRRMLPLAVVHVGHASEALLRKVEQFHEEFAPSIAIGLMSDTGESRFIGPGLEALSIEPPSALSKDQWTQPSKASDLFSDLNQWMLKVLLASELPDKLLNAPRRDYRSGAELADAAQVSAMSASRFMRRLQEEGFLEVSGRSMRLVRRRELFRRWQSSAMRSSPELRMSYLIPGAGPHHLHKVASRLDACIGVFAAADLLHLGHVSGVAPHVYVRRLSPPPAEGWPGLLRARPGEPVQITLKQPTAPESLFRGAVRVNDVLVSDVLQIWLDASAHPSRGVEQADLLASTVLRDALGDAV